MVRRGRPGSAALAALAAVAVAVLSCVAPPPPAGGTTRAADPDRDTRAVIEAHEALIEAYETADTDAFVALLEPSAELLIFHPRLVDRFDGIDRAKQGLARMFERLGGAKWSVFHPIVIVRGEVAWVTSHVLIESPTLEAPLLGRGTEIWVRRGEGWRLVHGHWSEDPTRRGGSGS